MTQWGEESTVETPTGEVFITSMRQGLGKDQALALTGVVEGKTLKVTGDGAAAGGQRHALARRRGWACSRTAASSRN